jgi:transcriptional regulator with XRE-family HTH domain
MRIQEALGNCIRAKRTALGYSQESFSDKVGIHRTYIGSVERGERNISLQNLVRIADALGVALSALIAEAEAQSLSLRKRRK